MRHALLLLLAVLVFPPVAQAAIVNAASCGQSDVNTAIEITANAGDTVQIPAGTCTWSSGGSGRVLIDKSLTVVGAGEGTTTIVDNTPDENPDHLFLLTLGTDTVIDVSGLTLTGNAVAGKFDSGHIRVDEGATDTGSVRFHHITFDTLDQRAFHWFDSPGVTSLIDNVTFQNSGSKQFIAVFGNGYGGAQGDGSWEAATNAGSTEGVYIEDSTFSKSGTATGVFDGFAGARLVFRHNTVTDFRFVVHGADSSQRQRGARFLEIYNNDMTFTSGGSEDTAMDLRSGAYYVYDNTLTLTGSTTLNSFIKADVKRVGASFTPWGRCDDTTTNGLVAPDYTTSCTSIGGSCEPVDDNLGDFLGYPCRDQIGRGQDSGVTTAQASEPVYVWNNDTTGIMFQVGLFVSNAGSTFVQENRDYFIDGSEPAGYTPFTYPHPLQGGELPEQAQAGMQGSSSVSGGSLQ